MGAFLSVWTRVSCVSNRGLLRVGPAALLVSRAADALANARARARVHLRSSPVIFLVSPPIYRTRQDRGRMGLARVNGTR